MKLPRLLDSTSTALLQKELILRIRRIRSLLVQLTFAALVGGIMWAYTIGQGEQLSEAPEAHAMTLASIYFTIQLIAIGIVIPLLASVSITSEKQSKTWDTLLGTDMSPGQIVWGKLLGIMGALFYLLILPAPLLGFVTIFGGVSIVSIIFEYLLHFLLSLLVASIGILSSASTGSQIRAILQVYVFVIPTLFFMAVGFSVEIYNDGYLVLDYLLMNIQDYQFLFWLIPLYLFVVVGSLFLANYLLTGVESARDILMRSFGFIFLLVMCSDLVWQINGFLGPVSYNNGDSLSLGNSLGGGSGQVLLVATCAMVAFLTRIAGSEARVPLRVVQLRTEKPVLTSLGIFLLPGGVRNWILAVICLGICVSAILTLAQLESLDGLTTSGDAAVENYRLLSSLFVDRTVAIFLWGCSVLALAWVFAQLGFSEIISGVLANGTHLIAVMGVATLDRFNPDMVYEGIAPPFVIFFKHSWRTTSPNITAELHHLQLISLLSVAILLLLGGAIARMRGIPVFRVQRSGMDKLYLEIPEEKS